LRGGFDVGVFATGLNSRLRLFLKLAAGIRNVLWARGPASFETDLACNVALAKRLDGSASEKDVFIPLTESSDNEATEALQRHGVNCDQDTLIAIYPSTELWHRPRWDLIKLADVVRLIKEGGMSGKTIVLGSRKEGREWAEVDTNGSADVNLAGKLSILGTASLLKRCRLAMGNDGGLMHVAGAVGCPLVVIMTSTPLSYRPAGEKTRVIHSGLTCCDSLFPKRPKSCKFAECKEGISVEEVFGVCTDLLKETA
jgi:ADP-heptose:LPS heptosyltransferase